MLSFSCSFLLYDLTCCMWDMINLCLSNNSSVNATGRSVFIYLHMQINCYAGAVDLRVWTGDDSRSAATQVIHTAHSKQSSLHRAPYPHREWAWVLCELFLWQWQFVPGCHLIEIPLSRIHYTFYLALLFKTMSCDSMCDFHTILEGFWGAWETLSLLEQIAAKTSHLAKSLPPSCLWSKGLWRAWHIHKS